MTVDLSSYKVIANELSSSTKFDNYVQAVQDALNTLPPSQIVGYPGDATKFLRGDGSWVAGIPLIYDRATGTVDVQTSAVETSIYTKSIAGNDMGTTRSLRLTLMGDYLHNNVAGDTITARVKFGGTTFWDASLGALGGTASAIRHPWRFVVTIANLAATNSQEISGQVSLALTTDVAPTTGIGGASGQFEIPFASNGLGAIDTTALQTLAVTVQWSASSANNSWRQRYGVLELL